MTTQPIPAAAGHTAAAPASRRLRRATSVLFLGQFAAMWGAFFILAPAINWPASLGEPPAVILPLILEQSSAVFLGYASYFLHALLLIPIAAMAPQALGLAAAGGRAAMLFGGLAGFAKALGIARWLFLMPGLAAAYAAPGASEATQGAIAVVYEAFNAYAGGVGELIGVGLFAGIWTVLLSIGLLRSGSRFLGISGIAAAALLFSTLPSVVGIELPILLTLSGVAWQLWTLALAVNLWRRA